MHYLDIELEGLDKKGEQKKYASTYLIYKRKETQ